ncbi:MAG: sulfur carrier protein ThiS [Chloroflexi bacterium]|nr:sulfur carrier protein ThiS [Chloroflexota bacterium]
MIRVNDKFDVEWREGLTVEGLLKALGFTYPLVVVSVNGQLVSREAYPTFPVADEAEVKVLHMVAGG